MKKFKKSIAVFAAINLCVIGIPKMNAAAASISPVPGSNFQFDFKASIVDHAFMLGNTQIYAGDVAVTFDVTNNPGLTSYSTKLKFDDRYELIKYDTQYIGVSVPAYNKEEHIFVYTAANTISSDEYTDEFSNIFYFRPNERLSTTSEIGFQMTLLSYKSTTENISYSVNAETASPNKIVRGLTWTNYTLGDVDGDGRILVEDAVLVGSIYARANSLGGDTSLSAVNQLLYTNENLRATAPNLICAEAADANSDGYITDDGDMQAILEYYASHAAANPIDSIIGKKIKKGLYL